MVRRQSGSAGVRAAMLTAIAVACVFAATHFADLGAAIVRAVGSAPVPSGHPTPMPAIVAPAPHATKPATGAARGPQSAGGACVTFPATSNPSGRTVFVDAGHGG